MSNVSGGAGHDRLTGGLGDDVMRGGAGNDTLDGGDGADVLDGEFGNDVLLGGSGDDTLSDNLGGNDSLFGNEGNDIVRVTDLGAHGSALGRTLVLDGGSGNDTLRLDAYYDRSHSVTMNGGDGNDLIAADGGRLVTIDGGAGDDVIKVNVAAEYEYANSTSPEERTTYRITLGSGVDTLSLLSLSDFAWRSSLETELEHGDDEPFHGNAFSNVIVTDFTAGAGGDRIDMLGFLRDQLVGNGDDASDWDPNTNPFTTGHLRLVQAGADVLVQVRVTEFLYSNTPTHVYKTAITLQNATVGSLTADNLNGFDPSGAPVASRTIAGTTGNDTLIGLSGADHLTGGFGDDVLRGGAGNDTLDGGDGADVLDGEFGNDVLLGGFGDDTLSDNLGGNDSLFGNEGNDIVRVTDLGAHGSAAGRTLVLDGGSGNDTLRLDAYNDRSHSVTMNGGDGNDLIAADGGRLVTIDGGAGDDVIKVNVAAEYEYANWTSPEERTTYRITLGSGVDTLSLLSLSDFAWRSGLETEFEHGDDEPFHGNAFSNVIVTDFTAGAGGDRIDMLGFLRDQLVGNGDDASDWDPNTNPFTTGHLRLVQAGADVLVQVRVTEFLYSNTPTHVYKTAITLQNATVGSLTADNLNGFDPSGASVASRTIAGTTGNDTLIGLSGADHLTGGFGDDVLRGGAGNDTLDGGDGADVLDGEFGNDVLLGGFGDDTLSDNLGGNDSLFGNEGNDIVRVTDLGAHGSAAGRTLVLDGGSGNDTLRLDAYNDRSHSVTMNGGDGNDLIAADGGRLVTIDGGAGDDVIKVNVAAEYEYANWTSPEERTTYRITLGSGVDTLSLLSLSDFAWRSGLETEFEHGDDEPFHGNAFSNVIVTDFTAGAGGDRIDMLGFLRDQVVGNGDDASDWDPGTNPFTTGHLRLVQAGADVLVQVRMTEFFNSNTPTLVYKTAVTLQNATVGSLTADNFGFRPAPIRNDFNGDGRSDVLWRHDGGALAEWLGQANGGFVGNSNVSNVVGTDWRIVGTGDYNGDGRDDILWRNQSGTLAEWLGQANGGFVGNANVANQVGNDWTIVGSADFNGDGRDDILWRSQSGTLAEWLGQANGGFVGNANVANQVDTNWRVAGTGDFNGDGRGDILWRHSSGTLAEWTGQADGSFVGNANVANQVGTDWHVLGTGDFNGDGRDDILWRNNSGELAQWTGQANGGFVGNANVANMVDRSWHVASIGDFNGDGRDDIAWRNDNGAFSDWLAQANGSFVSNHAVASFQVDPSWKIQSSDIFLL